MPTIREFLFNRRAFATKPLPQSHFLEHHWVHPTLEWSEGTAVLRQLFPRDARPERPREWYANLRKTHWPGRVPPGNGPFYIPEWALEDGLGDTETKAMVAALKRAGFRRVVAHVTYLPQTKEYLAAGMRVVAGHPWNINPVTYRLYLYPTLRALAKRPLRNYTTERWVY